MSSSGYSSGLTADPRQVGKSFRYSLLYLGLEPLLFPTREGDKIIISEPHGSGYRSELAGTW